MQKILEKLMEKYWKNAKKNWKSQGNSSVPKSGNHEQASGSHGSFATTNTKAKT